MATIVVETDGRVPTGVAWAGRYATLRTSRLVVTTPGGAGANEALQRAQRWIDADVPVIVAAVCVAVDGDPEETSGRLLRAQHRPLACVARADPDEVDVRDHRGLLAAALAAGVPVVVVPRPESDDVSRSRAVAGLGEVEGAPRYVVLADPRAVSSEAEPGEVFAAADVLTSAGWEATFAAVAWAVEEAEATGGSVRVLIEPAALATLERELGAFRSAGVDIEVTPTDEAELDPTLAIRRHGGSIVVAATEPTAYAAEAVLAGFPGWVARQPVVLVPAVVRAPIPAC